jgi:hypothetical protein
MSKPSDEAVRKEFEVWYVKEFDCSPDAWLASENRYYYGHTQRRWTTWQASRSAAIQECAAELRINGEAQAVACIEALALKER